MLYNYPIPEQTAADKHRIRIDLNRVEGQQQLSENSPASNKKLIKCEQEQTNITDQESQ